MSTAIPEDPIAPSSPPKTSLAAIVSIWQADFPLNLRTLLFCFLSGSICSIPIGQLVVGRWQLFAAPLWTAPIYLLVVAIALVALPIWSFFGLADQPLLRWFGVILTPCVIAVILLLTCLPILD